MLAKRGLDEQVAGLDEMARKHGTTLHAFAQRLTQNKNDAADLVHDALERAMRAAPTDGPDELLRWTIAVMRNLFIDRCRQRRASVTALRTLRETSEHAVVQYFEETPAPLWARLDWSDVSAALEQLDPPFREVFRLHAGQVPLARMAEELRIPVSTVGTRLFRARQKLRVHLTEVSVQRNLGDPQLGPKC